MPSSTIRKAVFPVAGFGTRFLPATKSIPKEMLPIIDKPLIQYAVEEALEAGITQLIFITGNKKKAIEDYFDRDWELEDALAKTNKHAALDAIRNTLPSYAECIYIRQRQILGLGHAVLQAQSVIGDEYFAVLLADDLIYDTPGCLSQMVKAHQQTEASIVAVENIALTDTRQYGIVDIDASADAALPALRGIIEKPLPEDAPSTLGVIGRYVLSPAVFDCIRDAGIGFGGEHQLTDGIGGLLVTQSVRAFPLRGVRYDCGSKRGLLAATIAYARQNPEFSDLLGEPSKNPLR